MNPKTRGLIGAWQIGGGLYGFVVIDAIQAQASLPPWSRFAIPLLAIFYGLSILAGVLLLRRHRWAESLTAVLQLPQLIQLEGSAVTYLCYSGAGLVPLITEKGSLRLDWAIGSKFALTLQGPTTTAALGVNLAAAYVLWQMVRSQDTEPVPKANLPPSLRVAA